MGRRSSNKTKRTRRNDDSVKAKPSRRQRFQARQRNTWLAFLGKVMLFFLPAAFLTWWLIVTVLMQGKQLDILVLDLDPSHGSSGSSTADSSPLTVKNYGREGNNDDGFIQLPESIRFGGPDKNALLVFNDLLGSARRIDRAGNKVPCVFVPIDKEQHLNYALNGIPVDETDNQWKPFDAYVRDLASQLAGKSGGKKKVILVLDVDHPDLAGRLPPQVNPFIELCRNMWDEDLRDDLAEEFGEELELHIWLSHDYGQKSYFDSNPKQVESIFKHRFEIGLSGDIFNWVSKQYNGRHDVGYNDLKEYLRTYVIKDAKLHGLSQTPVFLEPKIAENFTLLRYVNVSEAGSGSIFNYPQRKNGNQLDALWEDFATAKRQYNWEIENPLAVQQANVLLLQMERLWYEGKTESLLFAGLKGKLEHRLRSRLTIEPVVHSLRDAEAAELRSSIDIEQVTLPDLPKEWLVPIEVSADATEEERKTAEGKSDERKKEIARWSDSHTDWKPALKLWQILLEEPVQNGKYRLMIGQGLDLLTKPSQRSPSVSSLAKIEFNELAYLERIHKDLVWKEKEQELEQFEEIVKLSLNVRDESNRFVSELLPVLVQEFEDDFAELESKRRRLEDRLFAHDGIGDLSSKFRDLLSDYQNLTTNKNQFKNRFQKAQASLVNSSHELRHLIETTASGSDERNAEWIEKFDVSVQSLAKQEFGRFKDAQSLTSLPLQDESLQTLAESTDSAESLKASLDVFDGNLVGRRLLFWPALDLDKRKAVREGLADNKIERDNAKLDAISSELAAGDGLSELELTSLTKMMDSKHDNDIDWIDAQESKLLRLASSSSRLPFYNKLESKLQQDLLKFINQFHSKKSDLEFHRVASDLWGTGIGGDSSQGEQAFVEVALTRHLSGITEALNDLCKSTADQRLHSLREETASVWQKTIQSNWQPRKEEVKEFSKGFGFWKWDGSDVNSSIEVCYSEPMLEPFKAEFNRSTEFDRNVGMILSVQSQTDDRPLVGSSEVKMSETRAWFEVPEDNAAAGKDLSVYLRGHRYLVEDQRQQRPAPKTVPTTFVYDKGIKGTRLIIDRAPDSEIENPLGEVSILLDCSGSMDGSRIAKVKDYVKSFLDSAAKRKDIKVSLYAFGASYFTNKSGGEEGFKIKPDTSNLSRYERINELDDVWRYPRSDAELLDAASVDGFLAAVDDLQAYGETPIVAALDLALKEKRDLPQLTVLLTDGCEFTKKPGDRMHLPFDSGDSRLMKVQQKLESGSSTLVIFNMASPDDKKEAIASGIRDYDRRVGLINRLSEHMKSSGGNKLSLLEEFLKGVLPKPGVTRNPVFEAGYDIVRDENGIGLRQEIQLGPNDRPDRPWELKLRFEPPEKSIRAFKKEPVDWKTNCRNFGNEVLQFRYDPFADTFYLATDWNQSQEEDKELTLTSGQRLGVRNESKDDKPRISLASLDGRQLTPAPALTWLELNESEDRSLLVQDFSLLRQGPGRSNVHTILFPEIQKVLEDRTLVGRNAKLSMKLFWLERLQKDAWTLVDVSRIDDEGASIQIGGTSLKVQETKPVRIDDSLTRDEFREFDFEISRRNLPSKKFSITLAISSPSGQPLDRWLVQLLDREGNEPHRTCRRKINRTYGLRESAKGANKLLKLTHEFILDSEAFKEGAVLGIANLDEIKKAYKDLPTVEFPDAFNALD